MKNEPCPFFPEWPLKSEHLANNNNGKKGETTNGRPIAKKEKGRQRNSTRRWLAKCRDGWVLLFRPGYRPWLSLGRQTRRPHDQWDQWRINGLFIGSRCLVVFLFFLRDRFRLSLAAFLLYRPLPVLRPSFYMFFLFKMDFVGDLRLNSVRKQSKEHLTTSECKDNYFTQNFLMT